jgi:hypothetical protein
MPSSRPRAILALAAALLLTTSAGGASAQVKAQGFDLDRLYLSAPGGGWLVMDTLDTHGGLGGAAALTVDYAHNPLRLALASGSQSLAVVSDEAVADFGFAATFDRFRLYLNVDAPLDVAGNSGTLGGYHFSQPTTGLPNTPGGVNLSTAPDAFADVRVGLDARVLGAPNAPFRLGVGAQIFVPSPNTNQGEYLTDAGVHAMLRALVAGDIGRFAYAAQLGVHVRPLDESPVPGSPEGSELLFGIAGGPKFLLGDAHALVVGPEVFGETAFKAFFGQDTTGVEGLLSARVEGTADDGAQIRVKLGAGGGLDARFGTPDFRVALGIELFDRSGDRDGDGVSDSKDACPTVPGVHKRDPKTNGCPPARGLVVDIPVAPPNPPL